MWNKFARVVVAVALFALFTSVSTAEESILAKDAKVEQLADGEAAMTAHQDDCMLLECFGYFFIEPSRLYGRPPAKNRHF